MPHVENVADWRGKDLVDRDGDKIGTLQDVYVDTTSDEPMFGSVKEGLVSKHLTFVPLQGATASPNEIAVTVSKEEVKAALNIDQGAELDAHQEGELYHHYGINYVQPSSVSGRRLAKR